MKTFTIKRVSKTCDGTFGVFLEEDVVFGVTCEPEWRDNQKGVSCIPPGVYFCKRVWSNRFGDTFEVTGVAGREFILFHWGCLEDNTEGCVLVAEKFGTLKGKTAVLESRSVPNEGFYEFLNRTQGLSSFTLRIVDCC